MNTNVINRSKKDRQLIPFHKETEFLHQTQFQIRISLQPDGVNL